MILSLFCLLRNSPQEKGYFQKGLFSKGFFQEQDNVVLCQSHWRKYKGFKESHEEQKSFTTFTDIFEMFKPSDSYHAFNSSCYSYCNGIFKNLIMKQADRAELGMANCSCH